jgi:hypothetical protein
LIDTSPQKKKLGKLPLSSSLHVMIKCLSFWLSYLGEEGRTLGKGYGKSELLLGKPLGNIWEQVGNTKI